MPPVTDMPAVAPGSMHKSRKSCDATWFPWHNAHERGFLVFSLTFIHTGRVDEADKSHKLNFSFTAETSFWLKKSVS